MKITIFRNGERLVAVEPEDDSEHDKLKQTQDYLRINFYLNYELSLNISDYIVYNSKVYYLNKLPRHTEQSGRYFYECLFEGEIHNLSKYKAKLYTEKDNGSFYVDYRFTITGNAEFFLKFFVETLNKNVTEPYIVGEFEETPQVTIEFNNWNCLAGINEVCKTLDIDWYIDGNTLNFASRTVEKSIVMQTGMKMGFVELLRYITESQQITTVLYGYGASTNLPPRNNSEGGIEYDSETLFENRLSFDGVDGESKLTNNVDEFGVIEDIVEFDDIYPKRTGTVTSIDGNNSFVDNSIDFDVNEQLISGISAKVSFTSGLLIGLTFNISYDNSDKKVTLAYKTDETGTFPNDEQKAQIGDEYVFIDIIMPQSYIDEATLLLRESTEQRLIEISSGKYLYEGEVDPEFMESNGYELFEGDIIRIISPAKKLDGLFELTQVVRNINNPYVYTIKFGEILPLGLYTTLRYVNFNTTNKIQSVVNNSVTNNEVTNTVNNIIGEDSSWQTW